MDSFLGVLKNEYQQAEPEESSGFKFIYSGGEIAYQDALIQINIMNQNPRYHFSHGRYVVGYEGSIYNYKQLCRWLEKKGVSFDTSSDSELILKLFLANGIDAFKMLRGMFSIVIWDNQDQILYAVRDPIGIKPLCYMETEADFFVSTSQQDIKKLGAPLSFNEQALQHYFSFQYVPIPMTLTKEICRLEPGHLLIKPFHKPAYKYRYFHASFQSVDGNERQIINRIQEVMVDSVKAHMQEESSIGAFLSGGIDSSLVVAIAKELHPDLKTFTVGFQEEGYSEVSLAVKTASELGVENYPTIITSEEFANKLPTIIRHLEDPLADPSCVPLYFVAMEASKHVKTILSGEGADELFGGYNIYREFKSLQIFDNLPEHFLTWLRRLSMIFPKGMIGKSFLERGTTPLEERYIGNAKIFEEKEKQLFLKSFQPASSYRYITDELFHHMKEEHPAHQMQYIDIHTWLPGDILLKADRMTKAHGLELRTPFLDKEVFQVARQIPVKYKISEKQTKVILRKAAMNFVPEHVAERRKLGFPVPLKKWLQNELYDWAKELITESQTSYLIDKEEVLKLLESHARKRHDYSRKLWTILVFMLWHRLHIEEENNHLLITKADK